VIVTKVVEKEVKNRLKFKKEERKGSKPKRVLKKN